MCGKRFKIRASFSILIKSEQLNKQGCALRSSEPEGGSWGRGGGGRGLGGGGGGVKPGQKEDDEEDTLYIIYQILIKQSDEICKWKYLHISVF